MIAAVYCRKSTSQDGVADDAKSVTRQIDMRKPTPPAKAGMSPTSMSTWTMASAGRSWPIAPDSSG